MADKGIMTWTDYRGKKQSRPINWTIDIREHRGEPGWAWLVIAANPHLSLADLDRLLNTEGSERDERSTSWIQRRRWLFQPPNHVNSPGYKVNADGCDGRALAIMQANPTLSLRRLVRLLSEHGITRSRDWVRRHRGE